MAIKDRFFSRRSLLKKLLIALGFGGAGMVFQNCGQPFSVGQDQGIRPSHTGPPDDSTDPDTTGDPPDPSDTPGPTPPKETKIAFGSCARQDLPQPIWTAIGATHPDIFAFIGDIIYADTTDMAVMQAKYDQLAAKPEFTVFRTQVPMIATWDNHDYGDGAGDATYPKKVQSKQKFLQFFNEPAPSARWTREGIYESYYLGNSPHRVQIILLDLRWFRLGQSLLGDAQWTWLERQLKAPADLRILATSIQFVAQDHMWDKWANFPAEKARLLNMIDTLGIRNLILISGDMHYGELSMDTTPKGIPLYELTSSGLNQQWPLEANSKRLAGYDQGGNFGLITIKWGNSPEATLEIRNVTGKTVITKRIAF